VYKTTVMKSASGTDAAMAIKTDRG
jgi:hypothetical protein